jgi:hypothetical protein
LFCTLNSQLCASRQYRGRGKYKGGKKGERRKRIPGSRRSCMEEWKQMKKKENMEKCGEERRFRRNRENEKKMENRKSKKKGWR